MKLLIISTHPIQYVSPQIKYLSQRVNASVLYLSKQNIPTKRKSQLIDPGFGIPVTWDNQVLEGYSYRFLSEKSLKDIEGIRGLALLPQILQNIHSEKPSGILFFNHAPLVTLSAAIVAAWSGFSVYIRTEGTDEVKDRNVFVSFVRDIFLRMLYKKAKRIYPISSHGRKHCEERGAKGAKVEIVNYSPDTTWLMEQAEKHSELRRKQRTVLGIDKEAFVLIYAGRFSIEKDIFLIPKALSNCEVLQTANLHFLSVGAGPLEREWKRRMTKILGTRFHHLGFLNQSELCQAYAASDTLILPSKSGETWGLVVNEALMMHCNIIASSRVGCAKDLSALGAPVLSFHSEEVNQLQFCMIKAMESNKIKPVFDISLLPKIHDFPDALIHDLNQR